MIVKILNTTKDGWLFYDNVLSVSSDLTHCIKKSEFKECRDYPDGYTTFIIGTYEDCETGVLKQNTSNIYFPDLNIIPDFESDTYLSDDIFRIKIIELEFADKNKYNIAMHEPVPVYILSNDGKTVDKL